MGVVSQLREERGHLRCNVLRETEFAPIFIEPNTSVATGPTIDILKEVFMHGAIVRCAEASRRKRFGGTLEGHRRLILIKGGGVSDS